MSAKIPLAGVLGHPIAHSKSPRLHGYWLRQYGIAGHYVPLDVAPSDLANILNIMPKMGFVGCNVTIPHKQSVLALADVVTDTARRIGAANTLTFSDGGIHADNTDGFGFVQNLRSGAPDWQATAGAVMVIGAGGAARAIIVALLDEGVPQIVLTNRTAERADTLAKQFGPRVRTCDWAHAESQFGEVAAVVNTTALGMTGQEPLPFEMTNLAAGSVAVDIVYTPLDTPFLIRARQLGCLTVDGPGMLLHQAAPGFARWFGIKPEINAETRRIMLAP